MDCPERVVSVGYRRAEDPHDAIADVLVQVSAVSNNDRVDTLEEGAHQVMQLFGIELATKGRKSCYVCKENGNLPALAAQAVRCRLPVAGRVQSPYGFEKLLAVSECRDPQVPQVIVSKIAQDVTVYGVALERPDVLLEP